MGPASEIEVFSTCPQSSAIDRGEYLAQVADAARWSEALGHRGMLVYSDNTLVDPWLVADVIIRSTSSLRPLVAVQPIYMHPYSVAKLVATLAHFHGRAVCLNMLAGGFKNDLLALGDGTPHDERYDRTAEFTLIVKGLLAGEGPVTLEGRHYQVRNLSLEPRLPAELMPEILISGSSEAGYAAAVRIGATAVRYPRPVDDESASGAAFALDGAVPIGARFGVIARTTGEEAWAVARERFPEDRKGEIAHGLAMKVSDSHWHKQLSEVSAGGEEAEDPYWLEPFQRYQTFCPYLVGSYDRVGEEIARYLELGFRTFILDIPPSEDELQHTAAAFDRANGL